ncbi:hypothetical protein [Luteimicrobium subarcticum]|uniref:Uncharacterized protein n=1 Tax=Luteimicrobium subarcticum TaxID=620910 RepID=A0A2M8WRV3_9MICO|nr:hypothetical protein [Luteimicrobium subarcticum]PJI93663.1 hypothetical protein CLV34_1137 [Luteimicrobium subarcticum]
MTPPSAAVPRTPEPDPDDAREAAAAAARVHDDRVTGTGWASALAALGVVVAAAGLTTHSSELDWMVGDSWALALVTASGLASRWLRPAARWALTAAFAALAVVAVTDVGHDGPHDAASRAVVGVAACAGAVALGIVADPLRRHLGQRRRRRDATWARAGLSAPAAERATLPMRWSTGGAAVVVDDLGERRIQVVKALRDLGPDDAGRAILALGRDDDGKPTTAPGVIATGLSAADAAVVVARLGDAGASARVVEG